MPVQNQKRKPAVKLPRSFNGVRLTKHPFVAACDEWGVSVVAKMIPKPFSADRKATIDRTSVYKYYHLCANERDYPIPAEWVLPLCQATGMAPTTLRPDLYPE